MKTYFTEKIVPFLEKILKKNNLINSIKNEIEKGFALKDLTEIFKYDLDEPSNANSNKAKINRMYSMKLKTQDEEDYSVENLNTYCTISDEILVNSLTNPEYEHEELIEDINIIYKKSEETENKNNQNENKRKKETIVFISINWFLRKLALDPTFFDEQSLLINGFIQQYFVFITLQVLIEKIINTYNYLNQVNKDFFIEQVYNHKTNGLIKFLNLIILKQYAEIQEDEILKQKWIEFYSSIKFELSANSILFLLPKKCENHEVEYIENLTLDLPHSSQNFYIKYQFPLQPNPQKYFSIFDWDEKVIANQLTYITRSMILQIKSPEIISAKFAKRDKWITSPNVLKLIKRFDLWIFFIIEEILSYDNIKVRALVIEKWIKVSKACKNMNNFNDCMIITTGLGNIILLKLKKTWNMVRDSYKKEWSSLKMFCTCQLSYVNIRKEINYCVDHNYPFIPYLGILLKEIFYYEDNFAYIKDKKLINFDKILRVSTAIKKFSQFKNYVYSYQPNKYLNIFYNLYPKNEADLDDLSDKIEPVFTLSNVEQTEKRRTQTDINFYNYKPASSGYHISIKSRELNIKDQYY